MKSSKTPHIFLLDDNHFVTEMLAYHFKEHNGWKVSCFDNGFDMLKNLNKKPDVVILDYYLNDKKNGLNADFYLKRTKRIPTLILSAQRKIEIAVKLLHNGAYDYLVKDENVLFKIEKSVQKIMALQLHMNTINEKETQVKKDMLGLLILATLIGGLLFYLK